MQMNDMRHSTPLATLEQHDAFIARHIGTSPGEQHAMLETLGYPSRAALMDALVPESIRRRAPLSLPEPLSEQEALGRLAAIAAKNKVMKSFIGQGYYGTHTPGVILRNVLENPAWYTAYTPYQPEISQGRLEALVNFQTMVCDLVARNSSRRIFVADDVFAQTQDVVRTRARPLGLDVVVGPASDAASAG